jgi:hypothetical protein
MLAGFFPANAACIDNAEAIINSVIEYNFKEQSVSDIQGWIDTGLCETAGESSEWYILALSRYGNFDFSSYEKSLVSYLDKNEVSSASSRQKFALTLLAIGSENSYIDSVLDSSVGEQGLMSLVFGLHLMNNGVECGKYSLSDIKKELLSLQLNNGGWAISGGFPDVDATAMTIQALSPYYKKDKAVTSAVDAALAFLSETQNPSGDYSSYGIANPESTAQVLVALCSLGINCETDSRFIKNGCTLFDCIMKYRLSDGSFCHREGESSNGTATVQAFYSAVSYILFKENKGSFYIFGNTSTETTVMPEKTTALPQTTSAAIRPEETTEPISAPESSVCEKHSEITEDSASYKPLVSAIIALVFILVCVILFLNKKLTKKNILFAVIISAVCIAFILLTDFKPANNSTEAVKQNLCGNVTISVRCDTVKNKNAAHIPENGIILDETVIGIEGGESVYDVLCEAVNKNGILFEVSGSGKSVYVEGIGNIYEFDFGDLSGWMYYVNGESPSVGCGDFLLSSGDKIEWHYSCELGKDIIIN